VVDIAAESDAVGESFTCSWWLVAFRERIHPAAPPNLSNFTLHLHLRLENIPHKKGKWQNTDPGFPLFILIYTTVTPSKNIKKKVPVATA